eukprot:scaffold3032_cov375-Prasinococcus_capsulatus_cf.AAC.1
MRCASLLLQSHRTIRSALWRAPIPLFAGPGSRGGGHAGAVGGGGAAPRAPTARGGPARGDGQARGPSTTIARCVLSTCGARLEGACLPRCPCR